MKCLVLCLSWKVTARPPISRPFIITPSSIMYQKNLQSSLSNPSFNGILNEIQDLKNQMNRIHFRLQQLEKSNVSKYQYDDMTEQGEITIINDINF